MHRAGDADPAEQRVLSYRIYYGRGMVMTEDPEEGRYYARAPAQYEFVTPELGSGSHITSL